MKGIGIDSVEIKRFKKLAKNRKDLFFKNTFRESELDYCFSFKDPAPHLAGMFAAKEAVAKAFDATKLFFGDITIEHAKSGAPKAVLPRGTKGKVLISLTHTATTATAIAVIL